MIARDQGRYQEAQRCFEAALAEAPLDAKDPRRAELDDLLASVSEILGEPAKAEQLYREAETILESNENANPALRNIVLCDLGLFRAEQGRLEEAGEYLKKALAAGLRAFGEGDARTARAKSGLGHVYLATGKLADAEALLTEAVKIHESTLPVTNLDRIASETGLGTVYAAEGQYDIAHRVLSQAIEAARQRGELHPAYAAGLAILASLYRLEGNAVRSEPLLRKALAIYEASLGADCLAAGNTLLAMGIDALFEKRPELAESEVRRALSILRKTLGPVHPSVAQAEYRLAQACRLQRKYGEAELLLQHALPIQERTYPNGHRAIADTLYELAEVKMLQRQYTDAGWNYQRAILIYEKVKGASSSGLAVALRHYARLLRIDRRAEAKALEARAKQLDQQRAY